MTEVHIEQITQELTWRLRRNALYPNAHIIDMSMPQDNEGIHYGAFYENNLIAVASVFADGTSFEIRHLAINPASELLSTGLALLTYITERAAENGAAELWSNVQPILVVVYQASGFSPNGETFTQDGIDHIMMVKPL